MVACQLDIVCAKRAAFVRGSIGERSTAGPAKVGRPALVAVGVVGCSQHTAAATGRRALWVGLLRSLWTVSMPMLTATVAAIAESRAPFFVQCVGAFSALGVASFERFVTFLISLELNGALLS
eukprot:6211841-Pleurochrysis_carterae.AAC.2